MRVSHVVQLVPGKVGEGDMRTPVEAHRPSPESGRTFKGYLNTSGVLAVLCKREIRGCSQTIKTTNSLMVPPDGCGLQWRSGQIRLGCHISYALGSLGSLGSGAVDRAVCSNNCQRPIPSIEQLPGARCCPQIFSLKRHNDPGSRILFFSSSDKMRELRPRQDKGLAQGHRASRW